MPSSGLVLAAKTYEVQLDVADGPCNRKLRGGRLTLAAALHSGVEFEKS